MAKINYRTSHISNQNSRNQDVIRDPDAGQPAKYS